MMQGWLMESKYSPFRILIVFIFLSFHSQRSFSQTGEPIDIINADELQYNEAGPVPVRKLVGNVQLKQKDVILYCDRADFFFNENIVDAFGNVHIRQGDSIDIYGETLHYDGNQKKARLNKSVRLTDSHMVLTTDDLDYDLNTSVAWYLKGGTLVNDSAVLTSQHGYYYANSADVFFKENVKLTHPEYVLSTDTLKFNVDSRIAYFVSPTYIHSDSFDVYCEAGYYNTQVDIGQFEKNARLTNKAQKLRADTIYFERMKGFGFARSRIEWSDTASNIFLQGNYAQYFENNDRVIATEDAMFITVMDSDSLYLTADTLYSFRDSVDDYRSLFAFHHVKIFKSDMQGVCDSMAFSYRDSVFRLYYNPVMWASDNQLTADTMTMLLQNGKLSKMDLIQNAFAVNEADTGLYNQIQGKDMFGYFIDGRFERMEVEGNGESIYYAQDDSNAFIGVNKAICSNMIIYFSEDKKVDRIYFITEPDATLYPITQFPSSESKLKNFRWLIAKKPKSKEDLFQKEVAVR